MVISIGIVLVLMTCSHLTDAAGHIWGWGYSSSMSDGHCFRYNIDEASVVTGHELEYDSDNLVDLAPRLYGVGPAAFRE